MTATAIQQQANDVQALINTSRGLIADGRFIDISEVEQKMALLFDTVSETPQASLNVNVGEIAGSLAALMGDLDGLESDLTEQQKILNTETKMSPGSAAAAYQS